MKLGAGGENRTLVSCLASRNNNHYTTHAFKMYFGEAIRTRSDNSSPRMPGINIILFNMPRQNTLTSTVKFGALGQIRTDT